MRQPVDQPGQSHALNPGTQQGHQLTGEEQPVIIVPEDARKPGKPSRRGRSFWRWLDGHDGGNGISLVLEMLVTPAG